MTTPADRAKALLQKFGPLNPLTEVSTDGFYANYVNVGDLAIWVNTTYSTPEALSVAVYRLDDGPEKTVLGLSNVRDDDLLASFIQQVIDHHNGKQVV